MYGNCLLIALLEKVKHPTNKLYYISGKSFLNFHIMWKDKNDFNFHFTRNKDYNVIHEWWFKGHIERINYDVISRKHGKRFL